ncbi:hypothetical protein DdX_16757 [Ditylenchus destructor]|uniref:Uncharacterized protein n=1 Tax=Ditylenchus destructor TaxID=166010 RepID=A0AAD4MNG7_9BILA|nr:hypothetical protein DdX_16757 [Ditylenchus destructor]
MCFFQRYISIFLLLCLIIIEAVAQSGGSALGGGGGVEGYWWDRPSQCTYTGGYCVNLRFQQCYGRIDSSVNCPGPENILAVKMRFFQRFLWIPFALTLSLICLQAAAQSMTAQGGGGGGGGYWWDRPSQCTYTGGYCVNLTFQQCYGRIDSSVNCPGPENILCCRG